MQCVHCIHCLHRLKKGFSTFMGNRIKQFVDFNGWQESDAFYEMDEERMANLKEKHRACRALERDQDCMPRGGVCCELMGCDEGSHGVRDTLERLLLESCRNKK